MGELVPRCQSRQDPFTDSNRGELTMTHVILNGWKPELRKVALT